MPTDIASVLFNSGKFPSATSLLGLPDPMAHSTLAANNMFLSTNLFKMQELLKPLSTSSPISSNKSKSDKVALKIPTDIKSSKNDFPSDINILNLKNKLDFNTNFDVNLGKSSMKNDYSSPELNISNIKTNKQEFSASDLSISSVRASKLDFSLDMSRKDSDMGESSSSKIQKEDYSMLDLSVPSGRNITDPYHHLSGSINMTTSDDYVGNPQQDSNDQALNLTSE